jgi:hypothetical protein
MIEPKGGDERPRDLGHAIDHDSAFRQVARPSLAGVQEMKRVLLVGLDPATVDFSDPALPPGMTAEKIHVGVKVALADMGERGWQAENCFINPDETAEHVVERRLAEGRYDCVVIGAGVRLPPSRLVLFEAVVNAIHRAAPGAALAFNTRPEDTGAATARWI